MKLTIKSILILCLVTIIPLLLSGCPADNDPSEEQGGLEQPDDPNNPDNPGDSGSTNRPEDPNQPSDSDTFPKVVFFDDFEGESIIPDTTKWILCRKGKSNWARYLSESYNEAYQKDGYLYLVAERVDDEYLTGAIETRGKFEFQFGKVECKAKFMRQPAGNHTGIWMMPAPPAEQWPKSGEIDIMEHLGNDKIIYETVHSWYIDDLNHNSPKAQQEVNVDNDEWNVYGVEWNEKQLIYYVNDEPYLIYDNQNLENETTVLQWPFNHPFYIILSQSLGGKGTWAGEIDNDALPAIFLIDWIKVTKTNED